MKRIVYTVRNLSNSGGTERVLINKANWLVKSGKYDVSIITEDTTECFYQVDSRIKIYALNIKKPSSNYKIIRICRYVLFSVNYGLQILRFIYKIKPDIVISANARDFIVLPFVCRKARKIYEFHWIVSRISKQKESITESMSRLIMNRIGNLYDNIILLTTKDKEHCSNEWKNIDVIPNSRSFTCDTPAPLSNNRVIAVGNLFHIKGFSRLIDIWSIVHQKHPNWSLSIYGEGYLREELQAKIDRLSLTNVIKLQGREADIKNAYLQHSFALVSSLEESFSMTIIEAQTCGLPVIAFDCPFGPSEIIKDKIDGYLIPNDDIRAYADKVCMLIESPSLRKEIGYNAFNNSQRFAEDKVMSRWVQVFEE